MARAGGGKCHFRYTRRFDARANSSANALERQPDAFFRTPGGEFDNCHYVHSVLSADRELHAVLDGVGHGDIEANVISITRRQLALDFLIANVNRNLNFNSNFNPHIDGNTYTYTYTDAVSVANVYAITIWDFYEPACRKSNC